MGFLTEIFGAKTAQSTVEEAEAKLARFRSERERAFTEIDTLRAKRKTLLADDEFGRCGSQGRRRDRSSRASP